MNKILIAGASGICGAAASKHFAARPDWEVLGVCRNPPRNLPGAEFMSVDLRDRARCDAVFGRMSDITHIAYVAMNEESGGDATGDPGLRWKDPAYMNVNLAMLANIVDPISRVAEGLRHVTITQGARAYGFQYGSMRIPALERLPRDPNPNFYWLQEDYLKEKQQSAKWSWTVLRPRGVEGESINSSTNRLYAVGVYGAICKELGIPFGYPGDAAPIRESTDAELFAQALEWAALSPACANQTFNISNGDVFIWQTIWPTLADAIGVPAAAPRPDSVAGLILKHAETWRDIVRKHDLLAPVDVNQFLKAAQLADFNFTMGSRPALPLIVSTIKARQAGFQECTDTEQMMVKYLQRFQEQRLLPPSNA